MISLQLVLAAAADCPDPSETVRMVLAMTRINLLERSPGVRVVKLHSTCLRGDGDPLEGPTVRGRSYCYATA